MDLRTVLLTVWLLWFGGHVLLPDRGVPGRVRDMRGIFADYHARRTIDNVHHNEQFIFFDRYGNDDLRDDQHQLYEQQCHREPDGVSTAGPVNDNRRNVWQ